MRLPYKLLSKHVDVYVYVYVYVIKLLRLWNCSLAQPYQRHPYARRLCPGPGRLWLTGHLEISAVGSCIDCGCAGQHNAAPLMEELEREDAWMVDGQFQSTYMHYSFK